MYTSILFRIHRRILPPLSGFFNFAVGFAPSVGAGFLDHVAKGRPSLFDRPVAAPFLRLPGVGRSRHLKKFVLLYNSDSLRFFGFSMLSFFFQSYSEPDHEIRIDCKANR